MNRQRLPSRDQRAVVDRLKSATGHLRAVTRMVEEGQPCDQVLCQLGAVQAALCAAGSALLDSQVETSADIILRNPSAQARVVELERLVTLYGLLIQHPSFLTERGCHEHTNPN